MRKKNNALPCCWRAGRGKPSGLLTKNGGQACRALRRSTGSDFAVELLHQHRRGRFIGISRWNSIATLANVRILDPSQWRRSWCCRLICAAAGGNGIAARPMRFTRTFPLSNNTTPDYADPFRRSYLQDGLQQNACRAHQNEADLVAVRPGEGKTAELYIMNTDETGRIVEFEEKPTTSRATGTAHPWACMCSPGRCSNAISTEDEKAGFAKRLRQKHHSHHVGGRGRVDGIRF